MQDYDDEPRSRTNASPNSSCLPIALVGAGGLLILVLVCCGAGTYFFNGIMNEEALTGLRDNPRLIAEIGPVQKAQLQFFKSVAIDDDNTWVYLVTGEKGSGEVTLYEIEDAAGDDVIQRATFRRQDGTNVTLIEDLLPVPLDQP